MTTTLPIEETRQEGCLPRPCSPGRWLWDQDNAGFFESVEIYEMPGGMLCFWGPDLHLDHLASVSDEQAGHVPASMAGGVWRKASSVHMSPKKKTK